MIDLKRSPSIIIGKNEGQKIEGTGDMLKPYFTLVKKFFFSYAEVNRFYYDCY